MQSNTSFRYARENREYELAIGWNDAALKKGEIHFDIKAKCIAKEISREFAIIASVSLEPPRNGLPDLVARASVASAKDWEFARISLADLLDESQVTDRIPAWVFGGEAVTGCLIRSGIGSTVGQILDCKNRTAQADRLWQRMKEIAACVREHLPEVTSKSAFRAMQCIDRAGFQANAAHNLDSRRHPRPPEQ